MSQPRFSDQVMSALRQQVVQRGEDPPPGQVRYNIVVGDFATNGQAVPAAVAATLRTIADQLDPATDKEPA